MKSILVSDHRIGSLMDLGVSGEDIEKKYIIIYYKNILGSEK